VSRKSICYAQATSSLKVTVCCSVTSSSHWTSIFWNKQHETVTVNTDCYRGMFEKFLAPAMWCLCIWNVWFLEGCLIPYS